MPSPRQAVHEQAAFAFPSPRRPAPVLQGPQADPHHLGGALAIAAHVLEGEFNVSLLDFPQPQSRLEDYRTFTAA
jgi:hypothetical protein